MVLLHDVRWASAEALDKLLTWLGHHRWDPAKPEVVGYQVTDLVGYLRATASHPQPYDDRGALEQARSAEWRKQHPSRAAPPAVLATTGSEAL